MIRKTLMTLTVLSLLAMALPLSAQRSACIPVHGLDRGSLAFDGGERMSFVIHYKWGIINADVASASVSVDTTVLNGRKVFGARIFGQNARKFDPFFKMREDFRTWFMADGLEPRRFTRDSKEGNWFATNDYTFNWNSMQIDAALDSKTRGPRTMQLPLTDCTFDVLSLFYFARNLDFDAVEPGKKYPLTFAIDDDICNIYFIYKGVEVKNIKGIGKVRTRRFTVSLASGQVFGEDGGAAGDMWFTDDENRLLVWFDTPIRIGHIYGRLTSFEGTKHPFDALVEPAR